MVQETIRMILPFIYEPIFQTINLNDGFRPNRSPHNAITKAHRNMSGKTFVIEGDIKGAYDNVNHKITIDILSKHIHDQKIINLIDKGFKTKRFDEKANKIVNSLLGIPQGGIASPLLFNISMHEFDFIMEDQIKTKYENTTRLSM